MSTVRSTEDLVSYDLKHTLGFVGNPRRFNGKPFAVCFPPTLKNSAVAMTRAQALLIVVGDPAVLGLDPLWRSWLNFVYTRGGWTGSDGPTWDPEAEVRETGGYDQEVRELGLAEMRALTARMEALSMGTQALVEEDGDVGEVEWRDAE
jgi:helicase MOV-10